MVRFEKKIIQKKKNETQKKKKVYLLQFLLRLLLLDQEALERSKNVLANSKSQYFSIFSNFFWYQMEFPY